MAKARVQIKTANRVQGLFRPKGIREPDPSDRIKFGPALAGLVLFGLLPIKRWPVPPSLGTAAPSGLTSEVGAVAGMNLWT
jgi:hypothetical protein